MESWGALVARVLAVVAIVVTLYWAIYLPNPRGLPKSEGFSRLLVRLLAVIVMLILVIGLVITSY